MYDNNHDLWGNKAIKQTMRNIEYWRENRKSDWASARFIYKNKNSINIVHDAKGRPPLHCK